MFSFLGAYGLPGVQSTLETIENQFWWGRYEDQFWTPAVIDKATRDTGNTGYTDVLRPGLILGKKTSTGKLLQWDPTAVDGTQFACAILDISLRVTSGDRWYSVLVVGRLKSDRLLIPGNVDFGISGNANELLLRSQLSPRFLFSDSLNLGESGFCPFRIIVAKTADYTVTAADNGTLFTNRGAVAAVNFTLPVTPTKGLVYYFYAAANQALTVTAGTADTLVAFNDIAADSIAFSTAGEIVGGSVMIVGDGTGWLSFPWTTGLGATAQTATIAT